MKTDADQVVRKRSGKSSGYGMLAGLVVYATVGKLGLYLLLVCWPAYATAAVDKTYSVGMLLSRLFAGVLASVLAGLIATKIAKDRGKTAWLVGTAIFIIAGYIHFFRVWVDYPIWYHFAYLLPIIPLTGLSGLKRDK